MRIIVVTPAVPHPFGDTAARWFYVLITELAARGHKVVALAATEEPEARVAEARQWIDGWVADLSNDWSAKRKTTQIANLEPQALSQSAPRLTLTCHRQQVDANALRRKWQNLVRPRSELLQDSQFMALLGGELAKGYDVLHLEQMSTGWLGVNVPRALLNVHFFDVIDWAEKKTRTWPERKAFWQAKRATERLLHSIPNVRLLTPRLKEAAEAINPNNRYWVVPFALDVSLYDLQPPAAEPVVGLIGSMHWEPSRSAAERLITRIWPLVKRRAPRAKLLIAGWNAARFLQKYASLPDVTLSENLAHPTQFFSQAAVLVYAPSRGSGMKVKVMEAMAYGVPVVTNSEGVEGIDHRNGRDCWVAESDEDLANSVCRLLENPAEREHMRLAGRSLIEDFYSPRPVVDKMLEVYGQLQPPPPSARVPSSTLKNVCI